MKATPRVSVGPAATAPHHSRYQFLNQDERRAQVDVDMFVEERVVDIQRPAEFVGAGVVDQDVHRSRGGGQPADIVSAVEVRGDETCFATGVFDLLDSLDAAFGIAAVDDDVRPAPVTSAVAPPIVVAMVGEAQARRH